MTPPDLFDEPFAPPGRSCLGDEEWCGLPATHVGRDETGLEWFCCAVHTREAGSRPGTRLLTTAEWFEELRVGILARDAVARLRDFPGD